MGCCFTSLEAALATGLCRECSGRRVASHIAVLYLILSIGR